MYFANEIDPKKKPYHWYKEQVVQGAKEHGLPEGYIKKILPTDAIQQRLENQRQHLGHFYNWDERIKEWIAFLNNALQAKGSSHEG